MSGSAVPDFLFKVLSTILKFCYFPAATLFRGSSPTEESTLIFVCFYSFSESTLFSFCSWLAGWMALSEKTFQDGAGWDSRVPTTAAQIYIEVARDRLYN